MLSGGSPKRLYKAPTDYTKPQSDYTKPNRLYKAPTGNSPYKAPTEYTKPEKTITKHPKYYTKTPNIRQNPKLLDTNQKYLTRVVTHINLTCNI